MAMRYLLRLALAEDIFVGRYKTSFTYSMSFKHAGALLKASETLEKSFLIERICIALFILRQIETTSPLGFSFGVSLVEV